ncbi:Uncharacterized protein TCM_013656 [Theobroma cacao]|uniref:Uncharacterized protein n=1 Tax=Theobroma cacao TaxID=3641 RepID=A0A061FX96_THECC|nr:Uncharacterized protein TCM_013656 [Theobroma cacao]
MLLVKHISDVPKDSAVLLYAIVSGKSINIVGVQWDSNEELLSPKVPLDAGIISRFYAHEYSVTRGSSSSAPPPPPQPTQPQNLTLPQRMECLKLQST